MYVVMEGWCVLSPSAFGSPCTAGHFDAKIRELNYVCSAIVHVYRLNMVQVKCGDIFGHAFQLWRLDRVCVSSSCPWYLPGVQS